MSRSHTVFDKSGKWWAVTSNRKEAIQEASWRAAQAGETMIVKVGHINECGAEAVAMVTKSGEVF